MTKQEFKDFCHREFTKRGFRKQKSAYYLCGSDGLLGELHLQASCGKAYYINFHFFLGDFSGIKRYPSYYESSLYGRIRVLSKVTVKGKHFMHALIEYEKYEEVELLQYISKELDDIVMPPLLYGHRFLLERFDRIRIRPTTTMNEVLAKLNSKNDNI